MNLGRACAVVLLSAFALPTVVVGVSAGPAAAATSRDDRYGPAQPQAVMSAATTPRVDAQCDRGASTGSVPVTIAFDQAGQASGWTAKRTTGELVAAGPGSVAVFGVQVDCRHPHPVAGLVYFDVRPTAHPSATGSPVTAKTQPVRFYVNVLPSAGGADGQGVSAPVLTGGAAAVLACLGVLGALRRVRSVTRSRIPHRPR